MGQNLISFMELYYFGVHLLSYLMDMISLFTDLFFPSLMNEWSLTPNQAGSLGSVALIGMMLGALIFGPLADKMGRKNVILFCIALFSLFTGLIGISSGPVEFGIYRFIAGLGLGGVMPNAIALMTEYSPKSLKSTSSFDYV